MKPTAPLRNNFGMFATTPRPWLISFSLDLPCVMSIPLSEEKQAEVIESMIRFFSEKLDVELSEVQARSLLTYIFREIGPFSYNQGVEDAQKHLIRVADDLRGTCFQGTMGGNVVLRLRRLKVRTGRAI